MYIKDLTTGKVRLYGTDKHDSLVKSPDGTSLIYHHLQNGDTSEPDGHYRFCEEDGRVPEAIDEVMVHGAFCYFNIGGFNKKDRLKGHRYPDLNELVRMLVDEYKLKHPEIADDIVGYDSIIDMFPQVWSSTAGGFEAPGMVAGAAITTEQTIVIQLDLTIKSYSHLYPFDSKIIYGVFFNEKFAYLTEKPSKMFFEDLKNKHMKSRYEAIEVY